MDKQKIYDLDVIPVRKMDNVESMKRAFRDTIKNAIDNQTTKIIKVRCKIGRAHV